MTERDQEAEFLEKLDDNTPACGRSIAKSVGEDEDEKIIEDLDAAMNHAIKELKAAWSKNGWDLNFSYKLEVIVRGLDCEKEGDGRILVKKTFEG